MDLVFTFFFKGREKETHLKNNGVYVDGVVCKVFFAKTQSVVVKYKVNGKTYRYTCPYSVPNNIPPQEYIGTIWPMVVDKKSPEKAIFITEYNFTFFENIIPDSVKIKFEYP